jgi:hypothetical protein
MDSGRNHDRWVAVPACDCNIYRQFFATLSAQWVAAMAETGAGGRIIETLPRPGIGLREILLQNIGSCPERIVDMD